MPAVAKLTTEQYLKFNSALSRKSHNYCQMHLRHWIPLQKLSFKELFVYNNHPCLMTFLENQFNSDPLTRNVVFKKINFALKNIKDIDDWELIFAKGNMMALIEQRLDKAKCWYLFTLHQF